MPESHAKENYQKTRQEIAYTPRKKTARKVYQGLGFRSGLEIHQQLTTDRKLFCRCPAGLYHNGEDYDAEVVRHMRPTLSELGEYDGTALMEFRTRKNIIYRMKYESACTYDIDDTPPFPINRQALQIAMEIALVLKTNIVGELHITRKQYLDGSIPTGFQRTAIVGIEGSIPIRNKKIRIIQLSIEEDSCREVSDIGHERIYTTDRLGIPLIETVTYPDMNTPDEVYETAQYLRYLTRSTGRVNTGIGAAREDVNVSIQGGTRVEIKGVAHIKWIPELTHNEAFRQKALLHIREDLNSRIKRPSSWKITHSIIKHEALSREYPFLQGRKPVLVNLPGFAGLLSFFTQPGHCLADELSGRLRVIACLDHPNMTCSEALHPMLEAEDMDFLKKHIAAGPHDAQILLWAPERDVETALETIQERCELAFQGVPNETRKSLPDGTTVFERVLPGPDRMYPDTDSAPIPIDEAMIQEAGKNLPGSVSEQQKQMVKWKIPADTIPYILRRNLYPLLESLIMHLHQDPVFAAVILAHHFKHIEGSMPAHKQWSDELIADLFRNIDNAGLSRDIIKTLLPVIYLHPLTAFENVLSKIGYQKRPASQVIQSIPKMKLAFQKEGRSNNRDGAIRWIMGRLRSAALGNLPLKTLREAVEEEMP